MWVEAGRDGNPASIAQEQLEGLWPPHVPSKAEKAEVVAKVKALIGRIDLSGEAIIADLRERFAMEVPEAIITVLGPPPVRGVGDPGHHAGFLEPGHNASHAGRLHLLDGCQFPQGGTAQAVHRSQR